MPEEKTIDDAMKDLNKKYGINTVINMSKEMPMEVEAISTNCLSLDYVFGCGGLPRGRMIEIFGAEATGKSTLGMFLLSQVQKQGGKAVLIDVEFSYSNDYAKKLGVDTDKLILSQPSSGEEALDVLRQMTNTNKIDVIMLDSVAALIPKKELEGELGDAPMAQQARLMSKALRILAGDVAKTKTSIIFINQLRDKINIFWGPKTVTPGGKALKFYASVRLEIKRGKLIKNSKDEVIGNEASICAVKNKVGFPWRVANLDIIYGKGIDLIGDLIDVGLKEGVITRAGSTYSYGEIKLAVGRDKVKVVLAEDEALFKKIKEEILSKIKV